jgi:thioredoxin 1
MKRVLFLMIFSSLLLFSCGQKSSEAQAADCDSSDCGEAIELKTGCQGCPTPQGADLAALQQNKAKPIITFIELGSVNCVPCKQMQPVMEAIEKKYGEQIDVIFYDVRTPEQKKYGAMYKIRLIPTQVFLDADGNEIFRHEGFFPEAEIDKLLQNHGLKPIVKNAIL